MKSKIKIELVALFCTLLNIEVHTSDENLTFYKVVSIDKLN